MASEHNKLVSPAAGGADVSDITGSADGVDADRPARVVLIGDSELITEGLRVMLSQHDDRVQLVGVVSGTSPPTAAGLDAEVAVVSTHGRDDRARELVSTLVAADPPVRVVIFTSNDDERKVFEALRLGVSGYLLDSTGGAALADHLVRARDGDVVIDPAIATRIATQVARGDSPSWAGAELGLSRREGEVLQLLVSGRSNNQIAAEMILGAETVKTHLRSIYRKMGVSSRAQAVATAIRRGVLTEGSFTHPMLDTRTQSVVSSERAGEVSETGTPV